MFCLIININYYDAAVSKCSEISVLHYPYFTSKIGEKAVRGRQLSTAASLSVHIQQNSAINFYTFPHKDQKHM